MRRTGYVCVALAAILWAIGGNYASTIIDRGASVPELTAARAWIAMVGTGAIFLARRRRLASKQGPFPLKLVVLFGLSLTAANLTYYLAIARLPVAIAIIVQYTAPGLVVLWKAVGEGSKPSRRVVSALLMASVGIVLLSEVHQVIGGTGLRLDTLGLLAAAASALTFASYVLTGERLGERLPTEQAVFSGFVVASVVWAVVQAFSGRPDTLLDPTFIPGILFLGIVTTIAPFMLFLYGLKLISASPAGIISTLEPVAAALLAYLWLGQDLTALQWIGAAAVVVGIGIVQSDKGAGVIPERAGAE